MSESSVFKHGRMISSKNGKIVVSNGVNKFVIDDVENQKKINIILIEEDDVDSKDDSEKDSLKK
jgi:hypothetical protein